MAVDGFDLEPLRELIEVLEDLQNGKIEDMLKDILLELALRLDAKVRPNTPVQTGNLRRNWRIGEVVQTSDGLSIEYYNNTEYAPFVEYGHKTKSGKEVPGRYMLTVGEAQIQQEAIPLIEKRITALIEKQLSRLGG